jgi:hypothetical protein
MDDAAEARDGQREPEWCYDEAARKKWYMLSDGIFAITSISAKSTEACAAERRC